MKDVVYVALRDLETNEYIYPDEKAGFKYIELLNNLDLDPDYVPTVAIDTIAYIPNKLIRKMKAEVEKAFYNKDYEKCYKIFNESYYFRKITGPEWRRLQREGLD